MTTPAPTQQPSPAGQPNAGTRLALAIRKLAQRPAKPQPPDRPYAPRGPYQQWVESRLSYLEERDRQTQVRYAYIIAGITLMLVTNIDKAAQVLELLGKLR